MKAFILAGGFATRLWPLTEKRAKPLLPLAGKPLLTHLAEQIPNDIPVTVSTNQVFEEDFKKWKSEMRNQNPDTNPKTEIRILIEDSGHEDEKLGALGAVAKWITEEQIDDDILLLAGDNYVGFSIESFIKSFDGKPLLAAHDIGNMDDAKKFGTVICKENQVTAFEEKPEEPKSTLISTGVYVIPKDHLRTLVDYAKNHPDNIGGVFEHFLSQKTEVHCSAFSDPWFDIGSFEAYLEATRALVGNQPLKGSDVQESENTLEGSNVIGSRSTVTKSTLRNVVIFEDCVIEDCVLEDCIIDNHCILKGIDLSGKMLREGTNLTSS